MLRVKLLRNGSRFFQAAAEAKAIKHVKFTESCTMDLTLHCCACGLRKQWNEQEVDEVDEGQGIVPEQASCGDTNEEIYQQTH